MPSRARHRRVAGRWNPGAAAHDAVV